MENSEAIYGEKRFALFKQLQADKTLIQMHLLGRDYDRLTFVCGIRTSKNIPFFHIDSPAGFKDAVAGLEIWKIRFEFTGEDRLQYAFTTSGGEILDKGVWIRFPDAIERRQRRRHFRLKVPAGTTLHIQVASTKCEMAVIDVSLGGALGALTSLKKGVKGEGPVMENGAVLKHIQLEFPSNNEDLRVYIKEGIVTRWEEDPLKTHYRYGIRFSELDKTEEKRLTELIYRFQRNYLRHRLPISN